MPYNVGGGLRAGVSLAATGALFGGPVGAAIGGGIGLLSGLAGGDPYAEREKRKRDALAAIATAKAKALREGVANITRHTANIVANARATALRGSISQGRAGAAQADALPVVSRVTAGSNAAIGDFETKTNAMYDSQAAEIERDYALNAPIPPSISDYLSAVGEGTVQVKNMVDKYRAQKEMADNEEEMGRVLGTSASAADNTQVLNDADARFGDSAAAPLVDVGVPGFKPTGFTAEQVADSFRRSRGLPTNQSVPPAADYVLRRVGRAYKY